MTVKHLGQYGTIDDIDIFELLGQKGVEDITPWQGRKTGKSDWRFKFSTDKIGSDDVIAVDLGKVRTSVPRTTIIEQDVINVCIKYKTKYPRELLGLYVHPNGVAGFSVRKCEHDYFDGQKEKILAALKQSGLGKVGGVFMDKMDSHCVSLDAFIIQSGGEDTYPFAGLTYVPSLGPEQDVAEWFEIKVYKAFQGRGVGSALELAMLKELQKEGQKLLIVNGVFSYAVKYYTNKGYGFFKYNTRAEYNKPHREMPGHIMAKVLNDNIIELETNGHLDWSNDPTQPRTLVGLKQMRIF